MATNFIEEKYNYEEHIKKPIDDLLQIGGSVMSLAHTLKNAFINEPALMNMDDDDVNIKVYEGETYELLSKYGKCVKNGLVNFDSDDYNNACNTFNKECYEGEKINHDNDKCKDFYKKHPEMYSNFFVFPPYDWEKKKDTVTWKQIEELYKSDQKGGEKHFLYKKIKEHSNPSIFPFFKNTGNIVHKAHQNFLYMRKSDKVIELDGITKKKLDTFFLKQ